MIQLQEGEKIVLEARKHWFVFLAEGALIIVVVVVPVVIILAAFIFFPSVAGYLTRDIWVFVLFFWAAWAEIIWIGFFIAWTNYYLDVLVVTNKRIIDVDQISLFRRDIATVPLQNIQDIKIEIKGIIPTFFKFGNIYIQTAGASKEAVIRGITDPSAVKDVISKLYHKTTNLPAGGSESSA